MILCPGGLEDGGGIGRQMGYFLGVPAGPPVSIEYRMMDTRGPWYLGGAPWRSVLAFAYFAAAAMRLVGLALRRRTCVLHVNVTGRGSTVRKAVLTGLARLLGLGYLLHVHDPDYAVGYAALPAAAQAAVRRMFRGARLVLVLGHADRERLASVLEVPPARFVVLHNAVPDPYPAGLSPAARSGPCRFVFLGHLSDRKGVPELLQALAHPGMAGRSWRATIAGGGPVEDYRARATALGLGDRVDFPGWVDAAGVRQFCVEGDVLVLPSHAEGLAMAVLEGMSHGMAIVTTAVGAHPEVIEPGRSGLFVEPGDIDGLAATLGELVDHPERRSRLGAAARRRFETAFEVRAYAARLGALHAEVLRQGLGSEERECP